MPRIHAILVTALCTVGFVGCGTEQGSAPQTNSEAVSIELPHGEWNSPVSTRDIDTFLKVINGLPGQDVPPFSRAQLALEPDQDESVSEFVTRLRKSLRDAIDPKRQGEEWSHDYSLAKAFQKMRIQPEDFALLATRMSMAWSANAIRGEIPMKATQRQLNERLQKLMASYESTNTEEEHEKRRAIIVSIQETVALSEFLDFVGQVPDESLSVIQNNVQRLQKILPEGDLAEQFRDINKTPAVLADSQ